MLWVLTIILYLYYGLLNWDSPSRLFKTIHTPDDAESVNMIRLEIVLLPLIGLEFIMPFFLLVCEAWANAVMRQLFD